jgi:hypothetical protein
MWSSNTQLKRATNNLHFHCFTFVLVLPLLLLALSTGNLRSVVSIVIRLQAVCIHPACCLNGYRATFYQSVKQPWIKADHSPLSSPKGKNQWSYTPLTVHVVNMSIVCCLNVICFMSFVLCYTLITHFMSIMNFIFFLVFCILLSIFHGFVLCIVSLHAYNCLFSTFVQVY